MRGIVSMRLYRNELTEGWIVPTFEVDGKKYDVDEDGFLQEPDRWSEDVARDFAKSESVDELTDGHWKVIRYIRNYYHSIRHRADGAQGLQRDRVQAERHISAFSVRTGKRRLQAGGTAQSRPAACRCAMIVKRGHCGAVGRADERVLPAGGDSFCVRRAGSVSQSRRLCR